MNIDTYKTKSRAHCALQQLDGFLEVHKATPQTREQLLDLYRTVCELLNIVDKFQSSIGFACTHPIGFIEKQA